MSKQNRSEFQEGEYGVRWQEVNRRDEVVMKEKFFPTDAKRQAFCTKVETKDSFIGFYAFSDIVFGQ